MLASHRVALLSASAEKSLNWGHFLGEIGLRSAICLVALSCAALGCGSKSGTSVVRGNGASGGDGSGSAGSNGSGAGTSGFLLPDGGGVDPDGGAVTDLSIAPANPVLDITIANGMITSVTGGSDAKGTIALQANSGGMVVPAKWSIDRGELGTLDVIGGSFVPNGNFGGVGIVSALYGKAVATTQITIKLHITQNGGTWDTTPVTPGVGGIGGVGGVAPGAAVDDATKMRLLGTPMMPANATEFGLLYPYDGTVWPRGIFAPLLQWQTTHTSTAIYVHLTQANYDFSGFYTSANVASEHIDQKAWAAATNANGGDKLHVEVRIADATNVYGPVSEDWIIASSPLKGTVYYNSYSTTLANQIPSAPAAAAILAIKPGSSDPVLALPGTKDKCVVCHTVSDDGSTLFAQSAIEPGDDYKNGASYDLTNAGAVIINYTGTAPDNTSNNRKFLWAGLWKDGTFELQSSGNTEQTYGGNSQVFRRDTGSAEVATGFDGQITQAVTPAFSRDGKHVAFNYTAGSLAPGGGNGRTLDMMDFACGDAGTVMSGAPACSTFTFSNLRRLFTSPDANGTPGWPAWLPDSSGIVFQNNIKGSSPYATWHGAKTQLWFLGLPAAGATPMAIKLNALNGDDANGTMSLPQATGITNHTDDDQMNYEPTVNPIVSGGYAWVVFTSRRMYGNIAQGDPYESSSGTHPIPKKLWVAAVDLKWTPGKDPSHPAFYMPGQELAAGNMRGFWVVDACEKDGSTCETGDECCSGYCRPDGSGKLVCGGKPNGCAMEFERCTTATDCCPVPGAQVDCINGFCATSTPVK
ncbi:MAG TPA: hypothetical protein VNW92_10570 [Polyangiaceae bacterium]|nr:hypothetical protein [Polyangiaceae bacterium]